jgi:ketosteroid isomerase-like protein
MSSAGRRTGSTPTVSQEDLDGVRAAWDAISANDFERFIEAVDPDVEFTSLVAEADAAVYRGHEGVRKWWNSVRETFPNFWADDIELRELDDQILAQIRLCGTVQGMKLDQTIWQVLTVKDGKVVRWNVFRTEAEALEGARLSRRHTDRE